MKDQNELPIGKTEQLTETPALARVTPDIPQKPQAQPGTALLVQMAIEKNLDVAKLEKLLDLHERNERRLAEKEFEARFAEMQRDYIPALKTKGVHTKNGTLAFKYCPLPVILSIYAPILAKHGFSYRWEEIEQADKKEKITTCILSGHGFSRSASISLPYGATNDLINTIQARGATSEYGRRYTFMNVTGCIVADEMDNDGALPEVDPEKIKKQILGTINQFYPTGMKQAVVDKIKGKDANALLVILSEVTEIRDRCQAVMKNIPKEKQEDRQKAIDGLKKVNGLNELAMWEDLFK